MKKYLFLFIGIGIFSIVTGILIGTSQSPILGIALTSLIGLISTSASILFVQKESQTRTQKFEPNFNLIGIGLGLFSVLILFGTYLGANYRVKIITDNMPVNKSFIWNEKNLPENVYEALDWIMVQKLLEENGYTQTQVKQLYDLRPGYKKELYAHLDTSNGAKQAYAYANYKHDYSDDTPDYKNITYSQFLIAGFSKNIIKEEDLFRNRIPLPEMIK